MINKIPVMLMIAFLMFLPKASYARDDHHGRDEGRAHHGHGFYSYANADLTLTTGMDYIDSRVLVDPAPDPTPETADQFVQSDDAAVAAVPMVNSNTNDSFIVNVPNSKGGYTPILLTKWGDGYMGPHGELYYPFPQVSQLKAMYGI